MTKKLPRLRRHTSDGAAHDLSDQEAMATSAPAGAPLEAPVVDPGMEEEARRRHAAAIEIVDRYVVWAAAGGILPIPIVDAAAVVGSQLKMLAELSNNYRVPFAKNRGRAIIFSLLGGLGPYALAGGLAAMIVKSMPVLGWSIGLATMSVFAAAATTAIGQMFIAHFESGGSVFDFDPESNREPVRQAYRSAAARHSKGAPRGH